jgi:T-complex protein 1 subunit eta
MTVLQGFRKACVLAVEKINEISIGVEESPAARRSLLEKCAKTSLNSKLISRCVAALFHPVVILL